jgi:hypothetical protein
VSHKEEVGQHP